MYKIFVKNLEGFEKIFKNDERLNLAKPLYLLRDVDTFIRHKNDNTDEYQNLCEILGKAEELQENIKYHSFGMFLNDLYLQYFDFHKLSCESKGNWATLDYQVSLLHQFMFPAYNA
ncbi:MAG: hypothetical protein Q7J78_04240 [Clostridiales bacterium]|nr:hypothetical protein [Clostridiales bacterium]